jgi:hypothetical protein
MKSITEDRKRILKLGDLRDKKRRTRNKKIIFYLSIVAGFCFIIVSYDIVSHATVGTMLPLDIQEQYVAIEGLLQNGFIQKLNVRSTECWVDEKEWNKLQYPARFELTLAIGDYCAYKNRTIIPLIIIKSGKTEALLAQISESVFEVK